MHRPPSVAAEAASCYSGRARARPTGVASALLWGGASLLVLAALQGMALQATSAAPAGHTGPSSLSLSSSSSVAAAPSGNLTFPLAPATAGTSRGNVATGPDASSPSLLPGPFRGTYGVDALLNRSGGTPAYPVNATIAVLAWGWGYNPTDLQTFFQDYYPANFPQPHVIPVPIDNAPPPGINAESDPSGGSRELTIDIEWSASMAPGATIYAIYAPPGPNPPDYSPTPASIEDALSFAVGLGTNLSVLSLSFGEPQGSDPALELAMEQDFQNLTKNGTTILASSGDDGGSAASQAGHPCTAGPSVDFPAASPLVLAVGGTDATKSGAETAWNMSGGGAAATASNDPAPSWQHLGSVGSYAAAYGTRMLPDVAATSVVDGYFFSGQLSVAYGTSFASPLWAGIVADVALADHTRFGSIAPDLYALGAIHEASAAAGPSPFGDVLQGRNCYYASGPGWDRVTGWGTPQALTLAQDLSGFNFTTLDVVAEPSLDVAAGTNVGLSVSLPAGGSPSLTGRALSLVVLDPSNNSPVVKVAGTLTSPGGLPWVGSFTMLYSLTGEYVNLTAVVENGTHWGVGSTVLSPPPPPPPPGPSLIDVLVSYEVPIFGGLLILFVAVHYLGDRRRSVVGGPPPHELAGRAPAGPATPGAGPGSEESRMTPISTSNAEMSPFCWRCGTTLSGKEEACPNCHTRFS